MRSAGVMDRSHRAAVPGGRRRSHARPVAHRPRPPVRRPGHPTAHTRCQRLRRNPDHRRRGRSRRLHDRRPVVLHPVLLRSADHTSPDRRPGDDRRTLDSGAVVHGGGSCRRRTGGHVPRSRRGMVDAARRPGRRAGAETRNHLITTGHDRAQPDHRRRRPRHDRRSRLDGAPGAARRMGGRTVRDGGVASLVGIRLPVRRRPALHRTLGARNEAPLRRHCVRQVGYDHEHGGRRHHRRSHRRPRQPDLEDRRCQSDPSDHRSGDREEQPQGRQAIPGRSGRRVAVVSRATGAWHRSGRQARHCARRDVV